MSKTRIISKTPKYVRVFLLLFGLILASAPIIAYILLQDDIIRVLNSIDRTQYLTLMIVIVVVFYFLTINCFYFGLRKTHPIRSFVIFTKTLRNITFLTFLGCVIFIIQILILFPQYSVIIAVPTALIAVFFFKNLKKERIKRYIEIITIFSLIIMIGLPVTLGSHIIYWERIYNFEMSSLHERASTISIEYNIYGGWTNPPEEQGFEDLSATGFFSVQKIQNSWWFVDPDGNPFISKGINHVSYWGAHSGDVNIYAKNNDRKYESYEEWENLTKDRIKNWNFNTLAPWSDPQLYEEDDHMPYTIILDFATRAGFSSNDRIVPDYFSLEFKNIVNETAAKLCPLLKDDPYFLGYFTDNELIWGPDWRTDNSLLQFYFKFNLSAPGKAHVLDFLENETSNIENFNSIWGTTIDSWNDIIDLNPEDLSASSSPEAQNLTNIFAGTIATKYSEICTNAIKLYDTNHITLGPRFASYVGDEIIRAASEYFDVISLASYSVLPPLEQIDSIYEEINRPFLIEEFSFHGLNSGVFEIDFGDLTFLTQAQRSVVTSNYIKSFISKPYGIGYHWYKWLDNPDGTFSLGANCGLVDENDEEYSQLVEILTVLNYLCETIHNTGTISI